VETMSAGRGERQHTAAINRQSGNKQGERDDKSTSGDDEPLGGRRQSSRLSSAREHLSSSINKNAVEKSPKNAGHGQQSRSNTPESKKQNLSRRKTVTKNDNDEDYQEQPRSDDDKASVKHKPNSLKAQKSPLLDALRKVRQNVREYCTNDNSGDGGSDDEDPEEHLKRTKYNSSTSKLPAKRAKSTNRNEFIKQTKNGNSRNAQFKGQRKGHISYSQGDDRRDTLNRSR
jgi:hypothetical protein